MADGLKTTPLSALHADLGARMVAFAGYSMPVQYPSGILAEHAQVREKAGLFDVSHMGQVVLTGPGRVAALERLMPQDIAGLAPGRQRYGFLLNDDGGILDDLMVANLGDRLVLVVNAARKHVDLAHMVDQIGSDCHILMIQDRALLALQGPSAEAALASLAPAVAEMRFLDVKEINILGAECLVSRSGYTGEDGFEISVPSDAAEGLARKLLDHPDVAPAGLGSRDSLRVEAGLPLYGIDINDYASPVQAGLAWAVQKVRRSDGARAGGFLGSATVFSQLEQGVPDRLIGLKPEGRAPVRGGALLYEDETSDRVIGAVTSGVFGPTVGGLVAMGYAGDGLHSPGTRLFAEVRGKRLPVVVHALPFVPHRYKR
ncbi:MAG: glycine cleavage system aminomethyltransferase GcvT [Pseudomonadota bacterium]